MTTKTVRPEPLPEPDREALDPGHGLSSPAPGASARHHGRWAAGSWRGALREFAIIVAGVMCALAAQAWWQDRQDREHERAYLRQLLSDTRENERRLDAAIALDSTAGAELSRLTNALFGTDPLPPADTLNAWFGGQAFSTSDFQPLTGNYDALLTTGDIRLIRTDSLRALLIAYVARLAHEQEMLRLFLGQSASNPAQLARPIPFLWQIFFGEHSAVRDDEFRRLRADPDGRATFFALQVSNRNRVGHLRMLREATRELRRALEAEPGARE